jgi:hypothetical protein
LQLRFSLAVQFRFAIQSRHFLLSPYLPFGFLLIRVDLLWLSIQTKFASPHCLSASGGGEVLAAAPLLRCTLTQDEHLCRPAKLRVSANKPFIAQRLPDGFPGKPTGLCGYQLLCHSPEELPLQPKEAAAKRHCFQQLFEFG